MLEIFLKIQQDTKCDKLDSPAVFLKKIPKFNQSPLLFFWSLSLVSHWIKLRVNEEGCLPYPVQQVLHEQS